MVSESDLKEIEKIATEFFEKMGFEVELGAPFQKEETVFLNLKTPEAGVLIGEGGQTLFELQHLIKAILKKKIKENFYFDFDINDYKKEKTEYLKELARSSADEAALSRLEKELPAMTPSERRIIHLELASRQDVKTESVGLEPQRRIIIRPYP
jgi:spoIIIJ-associated protein